MSRFLPFFQPAFALAVLAALAGAAVAQPSPAHPHMQGQMHGPTCGARQPSADAQAGTRHSTGSPGDGWRSAFEGYRPFSDAAVAPWRSSNDTVGQIGGWRAYAREAAQPGTPAVAPASPSTGHQH